MQPCRDCYQEMALRIWQQNDLLMQNHSRGHDMCLHVYCKLQCMVGKGFNDKGLDYASLKIKEVVRYGDPKTLANAMKSYPRCTILRLFDFHLVDLNNLGPETS